MAGWSWLDELERPVLERLAELRGTAFDDAMRDVSTGPPRVAAWMLAAVLACLARRSARPFAAVLAALLLAQIASDALKELFGRQRPPVTYANLHALVELPGNESFPSGHATLTMAVAAALWWSLRPASIALAAFAVVIGFSRVWLGVHYPTDVIAGIALGAVCGLVCAVVTRTASEPAPVRRSRSRPPPRP